METKRYLHEFITEDIKDKMVFIAGPRQVGKTTMARQIQLFTEQLYLNWDNSKDRKQILKAEWPSDSTLIVLDEIHKYKKWKTWIKGEFDKHKANIHFLVTGSARLDIFRRGGDSMQGRYHLMRLHPLSVAEIENRKNNHEIFNKLNFDRDVSAEDATRTLFLSSGFPEPFYKQNQRFLRRWQNEKLDRFLREDLRDLERLPDYSQIEILSHMLLERAGNPLSINNLREDLEVSFKAVKNWVEILEKMYFCFRVFVYTSNKYASLKKETKLYLWDWSSVVNDGARLENMVASHLLKFCHYLHDIHGHRTELRYLKDSDHREVDFVVTVNNKPWFMVEVKTSDESPSPALNYFGDRLKVDERYQVVLNGTRDFMSNKIRVMPLAKFLSALV